MANDVQPIRQNLVGEATKFLTNPNVIKHNENQKSAFLRKKGLTDAEITEAFDRAKTYASTQEQLDSKVGNNTVLPYQGPPPGVPVPYAMMQPPSSWMRVRDACNMVLIVSGASYGIYLLYQKFIKPWLTGRREKTVEESMIELQHSVVTVLKEVQNTLDSLQVTLTAQSAQIQTLSMNQKGVSSSQMDSLRAEISSLKALMIGKRTFPSTPNPVQSIPSWQLSKTQEPNPDQSIPSWQLSKTQENKHTDTVTTSSHILSRNEVTEAQVSVASEEENLINQNATDKIPQTSRHIQNGDTGTPNERLEDGDSVDSMKVDEDDDDSEYQSV